MSTASAASSWQEALTSRTVKQFQRAVGVALVAVAVGCGVYGVEKYLLESRSRFIENPVDVMMRAFAMGHFIVGWLFLLTSPRLRNPIGITRLILATALGVGLCWIFALFGATRNPFLVMFFYGYFLIHEVRDEAQLSQAYGDGTPRHPDSRGIVSFLSLAAIFVLMTVLALSYLLYEALADKRSPLDYTEPALMLAAVGLLMVGAGWATYRFLEVGRAVHGDWRSLLAAHQPLLTVYAGILLILLIGSTLGSTGFNFIILVHVTAWLVFVCYQLGKRPRQRIRNPWTWLRSTPAGFCVLHLGIVLAVLALMAVRVHAWQRVGLVSELLASCNFCYWGLMHISMSWWSSR